MPNTTFPKQKMLGLADYDSSSEEEEETNIEPSKTQAPMTTKLMSKKAKKTVRISALLPPEIRKLLESGGGDANDEEDGWSASAEAAASRESKSGLKKRNVDPEEHALFALLPKPTSSAPIIIPTSVQNKISKNDEKLLQIQKKKVDETVGNLDVSSKKINDDEGAEEEEDVDDDEADDYDDDDDQVETETAPPQAGTSSFFSFQNHPIVSKPVEIDSSTRINTDTYATVQSVQSTPQSSIEYSQSEAIQQQYFYAQQQLQQEQQEQQQQIQLQQQHQSFGAPTQDMSKKARRLREKEIERSLESGNMNVLGGDQMDCVYQPDVHGWEPKKHSAQNITSQDLKGEPVVIKPSKTAKRKHQINSLAASAIERELELMDKKGQYNKTKAQTQAKYGW